MSKKIENASSEDRKIFEQALDFGLKALSDEELDMQ
jgi:hypothetical protein